MAKFAQGITVVYTPSTNYFPKMTQPLSAEHLSEKIKKLEKEITEHHLVQPEYYKV